MIKRIIFGLLLVTTIFFGIPASAAAHVQASDNGISAVVHISPDDNPVAGELTYMQFTFGGSDKAFDVSKCGCELTINDSTGTVENVVVEPADYSGREGQVSVTFPRAGAYVMNLQGQTSASKKFDLQYTLRVSPAGGTGNRAGGINVIFVSLTSLIALGILAYYNISTGTRYNTQKAAITAKRSRS